MEIAQNTFQITENTYTYIYLTQTLITAAGDEFSIGQLKQVYNNAEIIYTNSNLLNLTATSFTEQELHEAEIDALLKHKLLWPIVTNGLSVYAVLLGGSRLFSLEDDVSDFDLNILISQEDLTALNADYAFLKCPLAYFIYNGRKIHWHYISTEGNLCKISTFGKNYGYVEAAYGGKIQKNQLIVLQPQKLQEGIAKLDKLLNKKLQLFYDNAIPTMKRYMETVDKNQRGNLVSKYLFHCCLIAALITNSLEDYHSQLIELKHIVRLKTNFDKSFEYNLKLDNFVLECLQLLAKYYYENFNQ